MKALDKKGLSESDICDLFISPAIKSAGWDQMTGPGSCAPCEPGCWPPLPEAAPGYRIWRRTTVSEIDAEVRAVLTEVGDSGLSLDSCRPGRMPMTSALGQGTKPLAR